MQDKTFLQAVQDLHGKLSDEFQDTICHMLQHHTTVTKATSDIEDGKLRSIVSKTLIVGQMITLLTLMKSLNILNEAQHQEFTTYLTHSLTLHSHDTNSA
jgi:hypothetical protein